MPSAGYNSTVKITGTPTAMVAEATTELVADTVFQVTNAARRILDPDAALTVLKNAVPVVSGFSIDYLFGKVTFSPALAPADVVTLTGNFLPTLDIIESKMFSISMSRDLGDTTVFKSTPEKTRLGLLKYASGKIEHLKALLDDLDPGGGVVRLYDLLANDTRKVLEVNPGGQADYWRGWIRFDSQEVAAAVEDLVNASLSWQCSPPLQSLPGFANFSMNPP